MSGGDHPALSDPAAPAAPPRDNGELVFEEPWESRAFGLALALHDAEVIDFELFRGRLIAELADWETANGATGDGYRYYEQWLGALERTVLETGLTESGPLERAQSRLRDEWARDHDHDHA